jgi:flavin reductase (DIM6/NTAB) family NADH-FMN oxidoreductase RutF
MKEVSVTEALSTKYPEVVCLVSCISKDGKSNLIPLGWSMQSSFDPPMVAISVGKTRYSHKLISETKEFVFTYPREEMQDIVFFCGTHSGKDVDKIAKTGIKLKKAQLVKPYLLPDCLINLECKVRGTLNSGDHTIFVGEILKAYKSLRSSRKIYTVRKNTLGAI